MVLLLSWVLRFLKRSCNPETEIARVTGTAGSQYLSECTKPRDAAKAIRIGSARILFFYRRLEKELAPQQ